MPPPPVFFAFSAQQHAILARQGWAWRPQSCIVGSEFNDGAMALKNDSPKKRSDHSRVLGVIEGLDDPAKLRNLMANAHKQGANEVHRAAFRRLVDLSAEDAPEAAEGDPEGIDHAFWSTIGAFEELLKESRGRATKLTRHRQKAAKAGVRRALADLATAAEPAEGFDTLIERDMRDLTAEAVVIRFSDSFEPEVVAAARARLDAAAPADEEPVA